VEEVGAVDVEFLVTDVRQNCNGLRAWFGHVLSFPLNSQPVLGCKSHQAVIICKVYTAIRTHKLSIDV
jgi:hypothetical protein